MNKKKVLFLPTIFLISIFGCISEDIGRRIDPGYNDYLNRRTFSQEVEDKKKQEETNRQYTNKKDNEKAMKEFNDKVKLKAPNK